MIKKKGIYIEKIPYGNPFTIVYYDGTYLLIGVVNKDGCVPVLYEKYSGTTFKDMETDEKITIKKVINIWCPFGVNYICENVDEFPIIDIKSILRRCVNDENERNN